MSKMDHRDHLKAMKCHFEDIMEDTGKTLDSMRCHVEESIINHDLMPGKSVTETHDSIIVKVLMPGIKKENIKLNLTESQVNIEANFSMEKSMEGSLISFTDKQTGVIKRKISLPEKVIPADAKAKLENGILKVEIPKLEKDEQINIKID